MTSRPIVSRPSEFLILLLCPPTARMISRPIAITCQDEIPLDRQQYLRPPIRYAAADALPGAAGSACFLYGGCAVQ